MSASANETVMFHQQIVRDNYDILNNPKVKERYPNLYKEVLEHDKISISSWYEFTSTAYEEYQAYKLDDSIDYWGN